MRWLPLCLLLAACSSASSRSVASSTSEVLTSSAEPVDAEATVPASIVPHAAPSDTGPEDTAPVAAVPSTMISASTPDADVIVPRGFAATSAEVTGADGTVCEICVWLATTSSERARGLMGVTDLGAADAMAFVYPDAHTGTFWMKNTVMPLSIAFFAPDGALLDAFDMEPCVTADCPSYATPADFLIAVEVPQGELTAFGMAPGSTLELLDLPCSDT